MSVRVCTECVCACVCVSMCYSACVVVDSFLLPCKFQGLTQVGGFGGTHLYLLDYQEPVSLFENTISLPSSLLSLTGFPPGSLG